MEQVSSRKVTGALFWKTLERFGVNGVQFVLQIVLARLLTPEHYGILSMMVIFTTLARVFVQRGFSTALMQNKDVTDEDYSSVLWVSLGIAGVLYLILFITSPLIGQFFGVPEIKSYLRVLALMLFLIFSICILGVLLSTADAAGERTGAKVHGGNTDVVPANSISLYRA